MFPATCDEDGNLYIRKFANDRPMLGPVVKIAPDGKRTALFDPVAFTQLELIRADAFTPAADGGLYQIAQKGIVKPEIYVLRFSSDGSASSPARLNADFEAYTFAAFAGGNFLVSGVERDVTNAKDRGKAFTAVFSADGRRLGELSFEQKPRAMNGSKLAAPVPAKSEGNRTSKEPRALSEEDKPAPPLALSAAEPSTDGNIYAIHPSLPTVVYVISTSGKIVRSLRLKNSPVSGGAPSAFHVSANRLAVSFQSNQGDPQTILVADAQTGGTIATYSISSEVGPAFACYSANEGVFTFLKLGEGNTLEVIRATAQ
jgi:hypothetical protein